jgi:hypothetical protein
LEVTGLPVCSFVIENERKLVFRKVKSEVEELPHTIQRHIEIRKKITFFFASKNLSVKMCEFLNGDNYIYTIRSIIVIGITVKIHFVLL